MNVTGGEPLIPGTKNLDVERLCVWRIEVTLIPAAALEQWLGPPGASARGREGQKTWCPRPMFNVNKGGDLLADMNAVRNPTRASDRRIGA